MFPHDDNVYECEIWHAPFLFPATMEQALRVAVGWVAKHCKRMTLSAEDYHAAVSPMY